MLVRDRKVRQEEGFRPFRSAVWQQTVNMDS